jgi:hypothetical protein
VWVVWPQFSQSIEGDCDKVPLESRISGSDCPSSENNGFSERGAFKASRVSQSLVSDCAAGRIAHAPKRLYTGVEDVVGILGN